MGIRRWRLLLWIGIVLLILPDFTGAARALSLPDAAFISGFNGHAQTYALSCESRSAVDWAAFWGVSISESEFQGSLPRSDNPDAGFVGDPNGLWGNIPPYSYGVHAEPVAALLRQYGLRARAGQGLNWDDLRAEIAAGRPVIVWIIGQMWAGYPVSYTASDGQTTTVARFEHTMVLIGYDPSVAHVVDAYTGWTLTYPVETFLASWEVLGNMAVLGRGRPKETAPMPKRARKKASIPAEEQYTVLLPFVQALPTGGNIEKMPPADPPAPKTYTVQPGDTLSLLAKEWGLDWRELAEWNGIEYPYVIYAGQVLTLR